MNAKKKNVMTAALVVSLVIAVMSLYVDKVLLPVSAAETNISSEVITRSKGEVNGTGKVTLGDAQLALRAALGITVLSGEAFWAADLRNEGKITLGNAQIILRAALGITNIEEMISSEQDTIQNDDVLFEAITDKEAYQLGDTIQVTIRVTNASNKTIVLYACSDGHKKEEACLEAGLGSKEDKIWFRGSAPYGIRAVTCVVYSGPLEPGETIEFDERTFYTFLPYGSDWNTSLISTLASDSYQLKVSLSYADYRDSYEDVRGETKYLRYNCPITINPVEYDTELEEKLLTLFGPILTSRILLAKDTDEIPVRVLFDSEYARDEYLNETLGGWDSNRIVPELFHEAPEGKMSLLVKFTRGELIDMFESGLYTRENFGDWE